MDPHHFLFWTNHSAIEVGGTNDALDLHGLPKFQNLFGWMDKLEYAPPGFIQAIAPICEVVGGVLLALGLFTRVACAALAAVMIGALGFVHIPHGDPFVAVGRPSAELAVVYRSFSVLIGAIGAGAYSLDAVLFGEREPVKTPSVAVAGH